jgi:hypothetical protein
MPACKLAKSVQQYAIGTRRWSIVGSALKPVGGVRKLAKPYSHNETREVHPHRLRIGSARLALEARHNGESLRGVNLLRDLLRNSVSFWWFDRTFALQPSGNLGAHH